MEDSKLEAKPTIPDQVKADLDQDPTDEENRNSQTTVLSKSQKKKLKQKQKKEKEKEAANQQGTNSENSTNPEINSNDNTTADETKESNENNKLDEGGSRLTNAQKKKLKKKEKKEKEQKEEKKEETTSTNSEETESNFEKELEWCIRQIKLGLENNVVNKDQMKESMDVLNILQSPKAPLVKKRHLMKVVFGDYRKLMKTIK